MAGWGSAGSFQLGCSSGGVGNKAGGRGGWLAPPYSAPSTGITCPNHSHVPGPARTVRHSLPARSCRPPSPTPTSSQPPSPWGRRRHTALSCSCRAWPTLEFGAGGTSTGSDGWGHYASFPAPPPPHSPARKSWCHSSPSPPHPAGRSRGTQPRALPGCVPPTPCATLTSRSWFHPPPHTGCAGPSPFPAKFPTLAAAAASTAPCLGGGAHAPQSVRGRGSYCCRLGFVPQAPLHVPPRPPSLPSPTN